MQKSNISNSVIRRLPRYYRFLGELLNQDIQKISSRELSEKMRLTASQIRQDLNCFGGFGQQGYGYNVAELRRQIGHILGLDQHDKIILIGAGNLGRAITVHIGFQKYGYELAGIFDSNISLEKAAALWQQSNDFEAVFVTDSHEVYITEGLKDCFALTEDHADTNVKVLEK